jgi:hypothetical protein
VRKLIVLLAVMGVIALPAVATAQTEPAPLPPGVARHVVAEGFDQTRWQGAVGTGANVSPFVPSDPTDPIAGGTITCGTAPENLCDVSLVQFNYPLTDAEIAAGKTKHTKPATIRIQNAGPVADPPTDFDLQVFDSDANATQGAEVDSSGDFDTTPGTEAVKVNVQTTLTDPSRYYLVRVVYFTVANTSYVGQAGFDLPLDVLIGGRAAKGAPFAWTFDRAAGANANYFGSLEPADAGPQTINPDPDPITVDPPDPVPAEPQTIDPPGPPGQGPITTPDPYDLPEPGTCTTDETTLETHCAYAAAELFSPITDDEKLTGKIKTRSATVSITDGTGDAPDPGDVDLLVYELVYDPVLNKWSRGAEFGRDGGTDTDNSTESVNLSYKPTLEKQTKYLLIEVVYFASTHVQQITGTVTM